jgi:hypothetical protein
MTNTLGITVKGRIGQFFCKHTHAEWFVKQTTGFQSLRGEERVRICKDCGKEIGTYVAEYEGGGFK